MLNVTTRATGAIRGILAAKPDGGLRLAPQGATTEDNSLEIGLSITAEPAPTDQVVALEGARLFIDQHIVAVLDDRTLDVYPSDGQGAGAFRLLRQKPRRPGSSNAADRAG